jgi:hypothetical protein
MIFISNDHYDIVGRMMCQCAAGAGELDILKWLRQHKCPWNEYSLDERLAGSS